MSIELVFIVDVDFVFFVFVFLSIFSILSFLLLLLLFSLCRAWVSCLLLPFLMAYAILPVIIDGLGFAHFEMANIFL